MATSRIGELSAVFLTIITIGSAYCRSPLSAQSRLHNVIFSENKTKDIVKKCYGIYGCFSITKDWISLSRPVSLLPQSPKQIRVSFCLYTSLDHTCQMMYDHNITSVENSTFLVGEKTKILAHGYLDSGEKRWIKRMVSEFVKLPRTNVLVVNWVGGSGPPYTQAVANIRVVGAVVGHFIIILRKLKMVEPEHVHVIGHSLGAHLAGYVGTYLSEKGLKLGRITGLDPAEPHFENTAPIVRLDPSDARLVDVIHTDSGPIIAGGLGLVQPIGHMDFFPNGGVKQPGCGASVFDAIKMEEGSLVYGLRRFIGCNHLRAYEYFTESISRENKCHFTAVRCDSYEHFKAGECEPCHRKKGNCQYMGYYADKAMKKSNHTSHLQAGDTYFLMTGKQKPFCREHYRITVLLSNSAEAIRHGGDTGVISARFLTDNSSTDWFRVNQHDWLFTPGGKYTRTVAVSVETDPLALQIRWNYALSPLNPFTWRFLSQPVIHIARVQATRVSDAKLFVFCGEIQALYSGQTSTLRPGPDCTPEEPVRGPGATGDSLLEQLSAAVGAGVKQIVHESEDRARRRRRARQWRRRQRHLSAVQRNTA